MTGFVKYGTDTAKWAQYHADRLEPYGRNVRYRRFEKLEPDDPHPILGRIRDRLATRVYNLMDEESMIPPDMYGLEGPKKVNEYPEWMVDVDTISEDWFDKEAFHPMEVHHMLAISQIEKANFAQYRLYEPASVGMDEMDMFGLTDADVNPGQWLRGAINGVPVALYHPMKTWGSATGAPTRRDWSTINIVFPDRTTTSISSDGHIALSKRMRRECEVDSEYHPRELLHKIEAEVTSRYGRFYVPPEKDAEEKNESLYYHMHELGRLWEYKHLNKGMDKETSPFDTARQEFYENNPVKEMF